MYFNHEAKIRRRINRALIRWKVGPLIKRHFNFSKNSVSYFRALALTKKAKLIKMSRVYGPTLVGNDMVINRGRPAYGKRVYADRISSSHPINSPKPKAEEKKSLPYLFKYMLEATPELPATSPPTVSDTLMAYDSSNLGVSNRKKLHINKALLVGLLTVVAVGGLTATGLTYKSQIVTAVDDIKTVVANHNTLAKPNPTQIVIHSADYSNAITALMTQQIAINISGNTDTVSPNTIVSWLSIKKAGASTYISVKTNQVSAYINNLASGAGGIQEASIKAAAEKLSNNLLNASGITINL